MPVTNFPTVSLDEPSYPALFYLSQGVAIIQVPSDPENNVFANAGSLAVDGAGNAWIKTTDYANTGWVSFGGGGGGTLPGGLNKQVQFNDNLTAFGGASGFEYQAGSSPNVSITSQNTAHTALFITNPLSSSADIVDIQVNTGFSNSASAIAIYNATRSFKFFELSPTSSSLSAGTPRFVMRAGVYSAFYIEYDNGQWHIGTQNSTGPNVRLMCDRNFFRTVDYSKINPGVVLSASSNASGIVNNFYVLNEPSGTPVAGCGSSIKFTIKSSTTATQDAGQVSALWTDATHLSRTAVLTFATVTNGGVLTEQARIAGNGTAINSTNTNLAQLYVLSGNSARVGLIIDSALSSSAAIAKFRDNTTDLYNFELSRLKIDKGTAFDVWLNTNAGAKSNFRVGATSGLHPGNAYGFILPYIGGSQSDGPGIYWTDGSYGATVRLNLNLGLNWQGCGGVTPFRIRKGTDNSSDGDVIFDFRPNDANFSLHPYGTGGGQTTPIIFRELAANGTNYVGFRSPDAITNDCVWVLPSADGKANQSLFTDGSKNLSWDSARLPYAELYEDNGSTAITITTAGTFYQWQSSTVGSFSNCSPNATNDNIVPDTNYDGTFQIAFSCSVTATANATIQAAVFVNGSRLPEGTVKRKVNASGDIDCLAIVCIAPVAAGQTIDLRFTSDTNGDTITPIQCNLSVVRIGA